MKEQFEIEYKVTSYDVDASQKLKYSMILKLLQETAGCQLESLNLNYEYLRLQGAAFLLTKVTVAIHRLPTSGEKITAQTWFYGLKGAQFIRHFRLKASDGSTLVECESLWITVNPETHRVLRPSTFPFKEILKPFDGDCVIMPANIAENTQTPQISKSFSREVRYSDIDCNNHMNNAVYADIICDYFPEGIAGKSLISFSISYQGEARERDIITLIVTDFGDLVNFEGKIGEKRCFEAVAN
jgi:medium-chain acyl-[acyl-carrier-protein] hydrolase